MANQFTTDYFEHAKLYTEKHAFEWLPADDKRPSMHIGFNINDPFFKPLGAEITSILETNKDIAFHFHVFVDSYSPVFLVMKPKIISITFIIMIIESSYFL